jgi:propanediol utilization protein
MKTNAVQRLVDSHSHISIVARIFHNDRVQAAVHLNGRLRLWSLFKKYVLININFQSVMHIYYKEAKLASLKQDILPWQP